MHATPSGLEVFHIGVRRPGISSWFAGILLLLVAGSPALADWTKTDVQVAARALSFVSDPLSGTVRVGIVYAENSPRSVRQAQALRGMLSDGLRVGSLELRPVLVDSARVTNADVDLFFLTEFIPETETPDFPGSGTRQSILCVTTDIAQVRSGNCIMGVRSQPNRHCGLRRRILFSQLPQNLSCQSPEDCAELP